MTRFRTPFVILALGLIPIWLFIGSTSTTTINGKIVSDQSFNIAGLVLGLIGAGKAFAALREGVRADPLRSGLIAVAGAVCLLQVAHSVGLIALPV